MNNFGEILSKKRITKSISIKELANKINVNEFEIYEIENNIKSPNLEIIDKILEALDLDIIDFFTEKKSFKLNQPLNGTLGNLLINEIESNEYEELFITSAYAKLSGVLRIKHALLKFKENGGKIKLIIGIDQQNTSYEALEELYLLADTLYIAHNENPSYTYHPKVYMLYKNKKHNNKVWLNIGSNNLTAGGLFINYESSIIETLDLNYKEDQKGFENIIGLYNEFSNVDKGVSILIDSIDILNDLYKNNYVRKEKEFIQDIIKESKKTLNKSKTKMFSYKFRPSVISNIKNTIEKIIKTSSLKPVKETFWFEMRKSTGGSRNILDLSSTGKLKYGKPNLKYSILGSNLVKGGVTFFDIDSSIHSITKDITILYNNNKYYPSVIIYAPNNQSWRLQLKGESKTDEKSLSQYGVSDFVNNILIFKKLNTNIYELEIIDGDKINELIFKSEFVAHNGYSTVSKLFGKIK